ncbi:FadR/GntR family transcriptional regulator, partial [Streptomyces sp. Act-28]
MALSSPRRSALSDQVIAQLRNQITSGEWPVGSRIPTEPELVEQLGVARNTVREAVRALAHNGLLDIRQGSGTYVIATSELAGVMHRRFADADPRHVAELRSTLESWGGGGGGGGGGPGAGGGGARGAGRGGGGGGGGGAGRGGGA